MSPLLSSSSIAPSCLLKPNRNFFLREQHKCFFANNNRSFYANKSISRALKSKSLCPLKFKAIECMNPSNDSLGEESRDSSYWKDQKEEDTGDLWEGAIMYQRNASISHVEYCTTLERLGLGKLSTEVSKSRAFLMGIRVTKNVKDFPLGTPVLVSLDVTRKKQKLRLDGIIRTVIALDCYRCGEPAAESIFSNFSLLLTEEPIEEPEKINMGVIFGEDKFGTQSRGQTEEREEDDDASIDLEDRLYFPPDEKVVDISKHIRDMVHLEITINALCDPTCKGLCLKCGINLSTSSCNCSTQKPREKGYGPLVGLRDQMQQK